VQYVKVDDIREVAAEKFLKKVPLTTDKLVFNSFFFKPRQFLPFHKHPATDEVFYIVEGTGEFALGNEQVTVGPTGTVYGFADVFHGVVNSGIGDLVMISVQGPKPIESIFADYATVVCPVCRQEFILKADATEGDAAVCPRCQSRIKLSKRPGGGWVGTQV